MNKIALIGGTKAFRRFLFSVSDKVVETTVENAVSTEEFCGMIFLPDYEGGRDFTDELSLDTLEILAKRKREGFRVYAENYYGNNMYNASVFAYETLGGICHTQNEAMLAQNGLEEHLGGAEILQSANTKFLPARVSFRDHVPEFKAILLSLGYYVGTTRAESHDIGQTYPMLVRSGSVISSLFSLSNFDRVNMRPNKRFKKVYSYIFSFILGVDPLVIEDAFAIHYPPLKTRFGVNDTLPAKDKRALYEQALRDAVRWHFDSGIVIGKSGEGGSVEMITSNNGQKLYNNRRVDAGFYTGWLLYAAGKNFGNEEWMLSGKNVFDYFLEHAQLSGGIVDGMFDWYYNKYATPNEVYSIDLGRDGIALCNMYALTGEERILAAIRSLAESVDGWIADGKLISIHIPYELKGRAEHFRDKSLTPATCGELSIFMQMASSVLGDKKYVRKVKTLADTMANAYPNYTYYGHTTSSRMARLLMVLLPVQIAGEGDYTALINEIIDYLASIALPCGGIYSEDNLSFSRRTNKDTECGITTPWDEDKISDQLYCVNNILVALSMLKALPDGTKINREKGLEIFGGLLDYVVKIQIVDEDPRFGGGWMRAYSITDEEYYGMDADVLWSSYCIMAGWTMGMIPLALLYELWNECPYI